MFFTIGCWPDKEDNPSLRGGEPEEEPKVEKVGKRYLVGGAKLAPSSVKDMTRIFEKTIFDYISGFWGSAVSPSRMLET